MRGTSKTGMAFLAAAMATGYVALLQSQGPANDDCVDAEAILSVPSLTSGSTIGSSVWPEAFSCGTSVGTGGGVWYTVTGTGNTMTATTCQAMGSADYDTKISVFCGDCGSLTCIDGNDDDGACGAAFTSTVDWPSEAGAEYDIYVHGFGAATGNFSMTATRRAPGRSAWFLSP